jgi:hypothetical protein
LSSLPGALILGAFMAAAACGCAGGRVRGGQGTEMQQEEEYLPKNKAVPPEGNTNRVSGPINSPSPPPVLEVDLERRRRPAGPGPEPEPNPQPNPETGNDPE